MNNDSIFDLTDKVALITGGAGLLAKEHALALASHGAKIYLADKEVDRLSQSIDCLSKASVEAVGLDIDVTSETAWNRAVQTILNENPRIDILVNNAGFTNATKSDDFSKSTETFPLDAWNAILAVNLSGSFLGCKIVGATMLDAGGGSIINIASLYGVVSPNHKIYEGTHINQPIAYSVSKSGVISLTKYLGTLWASRGVRVNCLTPGGVFDDHPEPFLSRFNDLNPIGRMLDKKELRGAVVFLASEASSHVVGHNLVVDGGWTVW
jgi:NAD(P)-dependent dehydrogenase (short-subunit alcohol dehydrogenase family)